MDPAALGHQERRYIEKSGIGASDLALEATKMALERAGKTATDVDAIVFATLSPDYFFPGSGVLLQHKLGIGAVPALDVRNQCSGFLYSLSIADAWNPRRRLSARARRRRRGPLDGARVLRARARGHRALRRWRGAVLLAPGDEGGARRGVLTIVLHSDGVGAKDLWGRGACVGRDAQAHGRDDVEGPIIRG